MATNEKQEAEAELAKAVAELASARAKAEHIEAEQKRVQNQAEQLSLASELAHAEVERARLKAEQQASAVVKLTQAEVEQKKGSSVSDRAEAFGGTKPKASASRGKPPTPTPKPSPGQAPKPPPAPPPQPDTHSRTGVKWSDGELKQLKEEFEAGRTISEMAEKHHRGETAIKTRLTELGCQWRA